MVGRTGTSSPTSLILTFGNGKRLHPSDSIRSMHACVCAYVYSRSSSSTCTMVIQNSKWTVY